MFLLFVIQLRVVVHSGVGGFESSRGVRALVTSGCLAPPNPHPQYEKILTRFLCFAWTPLGSSGGSGPLDPPASFAAVCNPKLLSI